MTQSFRAADLRRTLRLVREVAEVPAGTGEREQLLLDQSRRLLGAPFGLVFRVAGFSARRFDLRFLDTHARGFDPWQDALIADYVAWEDAWDPTHPALSRSLDEVAPGGVAAARREEVFSNAAWYSDPHVQDFRKGIGTDDWLCASCKHDASGHATLLVFHRAWGERRFSRRERGLLGLFASEAVALLNAPGASGSARVGEPPSSDSPSRSLTPGALTGLTPREVQVAARAARGLANKQIALELGIARDTVKAYLSSAYRKTGADGRAALAHLVGRHDPPRAMG